MKAQVKEIYGVVSRLDDSGTPLVYSHDLFMTQKDIARNQKEIIETQRGITEKLSEISKTNENVALALKDVAVMNKATADSQKELFNLLVEKKVRD